MARACERCAELGDELELDCGGVDKEADPDPPAWLALERIDDARDPFAGQLRRCTGCGARFSRVHEHSDHYYYGGTDIIRRLADGG